jgi:hypothetical protein
VLWLATPGVFLCWCYRAHRNLKALGAVGLRYGPATSVICYFVPIANLFWPVLTTGKLWHASNPADFATPGGYYGRLHGRRRTTPALVWWWWVLLILSSLIIGAAENARTNVVEASELGPNAWTGAGLFLVVAWSVRLIAALVAVRLVTTIDTFQRQRWRALQSHDAAPPSPAFLG